MDRLPRGSWWLSLLAVTGAGLVPLRAVEPPQQPGQTQAPRPPTFRTRADVVELDVSVTDETGQPIRGLTAADFTVAGHTISTFEEVSRDVASDAEARLLRRLPRDVSDNRTSRAATLIVLVVDDQVPVRERDEALALARQVVDGLGAQVRIGLLWTSGRPGVELTEDRTRLRAGLERRPPRDTPRVVRRTSAVTGTCGFSVFEQAARMLAPLAAQRKALVTISPYCGTDVRGAVDSMAYRDDHPIEEAAVEMVDAMRRANVAFYGLDPRGKEGFSLGHFPAPFIMGQLADRPTTPQMDPVPAFRTVAASPMRFGWTTRMFDPVVISQENLVAVAGATGGFAVTGTDDLAGGVRRLVDDFDHYYLIGFPPDASERTGFHTLAVTVNRPGATLRFRRGFQLDGVRERKTSKPALPTISGVMPVADVPLRLMAVPFATAGGAPRELLALEVEAPRAQFGGSGGVLEDDVRVTVAAVVTDTSRVERAFRFDRHVAIQPGFAGTGETVRYQIVRAIDLPKGTYQLRVSVESAALGAGSVYLTTDVPDATQAAFDIGGPLLTWADEARRPAAATLLDPGLPGIAPVFDRVFSAADTLRVLCPIRRGRDGSVAVSARVELIDAEDRTAYASDLPVGPASASLLDTTVPLAGLSAGPYRLRVTAAGGGLAVSREVGIAVR